MIVSVFQLIIIFEIYIYFQSINIEEIHYIFINRLNYNLLITKLF